MVVTAAVAVAAANENTPVAFEIMRFLRTVLVFCAFVALLLSFLYWGLNVGVVTVLLLGYMLVMSFLIVGFHIFAVSRYDRTGVSSPASVRRLLKVGQGKPTEGRNDATAATRKSENRLNEAQSSKPSPDIDSDRILTRTCRILGVATIGGAILMAVFGNIPAGGLLALIGFGLLILFGRRARIVADGELHGK